MIDPIFLYIAIALVCASLIVGYVMRQKLQKAKGSVKIDLKKNSAKFGETVSGDIHVDCLKDIEVNQIVISLSCYLRKRNGTTDSGHGQYSEQTIYRSKTTLSGASIFQAGESRTLPFELLMPDAIFGDGSEKKLKKHFVEKNQRDIRWDIKVRVDCKGIDLNDKHKLVVPWIADAHAEAA